MTCIVGVVDGSRVWLGGDRCISDGSSRDVQGAPKVWRSGAWLVGAAGNSAWCTLLRRVSLPGVAGERYPEAGWVDDLMAAARALGLELPCETEDGALDGSALIAGAGGVWYVDSCLDCYRCAGDIAIGSGADAARGALYVTRGRAKTRVLRALGASAHVCAQVCAPFDVISA